MIPRIDVWRCERGATCLIASNSSLQAKTEDDARSPRKSPRLVAMATKKEVEEIKLEGSTGDLMDIEEYRTKHEISVAGGE